jgi:NDP-sugar pyrophosphorylase family protein
MCKRAIILAGGKGSRLRPYTVVLPKPLMPLGDYPVLEIIIRQLVHYGFKHITLTVNHQADIIRAYFGDGSKWNILIDYSLEDKPLSTMGPLKLIRDIPENFLVMNGDVLTDLDFAAFYDFHIRNKRIFTISAHHRTDISEYGVLETDGDNQLSNFIEKPQRNYIVSMGVYMANKDIISHIPEGQAYGFDNLMRDLLGKKQPVLVAPHTGYWLDIGRPDDYIQAIDEFEKSREKFMPWE